MSGFFFILKNTVLFLVRSGHDVSEVIRQFHWTEELLAMFNVKVTAGFVADALQDIYAKHASGLTTHAKKYVNFEKDGAWSMGAMVGSVGNTSGAKVISFGRNNAAINFPASHADGFLADKDTGVRRMTLECISSSDLRTGWFALVFFDLVFRCETAVEVLIIGAGPIAEACIRMLNHGAAGLIKRIKILSKSGKTNFDLVKRIQSEIGIPLEATNDRSNIYEAEYLITATNAGVPVVGNGEIGPETAVLSLGIDDLPAAYIERLIKTKGIIIGDDLIAMEQRNVDPLALYYSRRGKKLTVEGKKDGAVEIGKILGNREKISQIRFRNRDTVFLPVGIMAYDLAVNMAVEKKLIEQIQAEANNE